ncbi:MAG: polysaccharide deacetylase family protein [Bacteroidia bacterium]
MSGLSYPGNELIVLNYHSTPEQFISNFSAQLDILKRDFNIISPDDLRRYYSPDGLKSEKCSLLFTFDDGLKNNKHALQELEKNNIRALLFVVPDFISCNPLKQSAFYQKNIRLHINRHVDSREEDTTALSWSELRDIVRHGHEIGCHTLTHTLEAGKSGAGNSEAEIVKSKAVIEQELGIKVDSFCSINNTLQSVGKKEKELIGQHYRFHFTTLPGYNGINKDPLFIKRRNVEAHWLKGALYFATGQRDLGRWKEKIAAYERL